MSPAKAKARAPSPAAQGQLEEALEVWLDDGAFGPPML